MCNGKNTKLNLRGQGIVFAKKHIITIIQYIRNSETDNFVSHNNNNTEHHKAIGAL